MSIESAHAEVYARKLAGTFNTETQTFLSACDVSPDIERILGYDNLIRDLKQAGIWSSLLVLTVPGPSRAASKINLKASGTNNLTEQGSPQSGQYLGWAPLSSSYLTSVNCATVGTVSQNNICIFADAVGGAKSGAPLFHDGTPTVSLFPQYSDGNFYCRLSASTSFSFANPDGRGLYLLNRTSSTGYSVYKEGVLVGSPATTSTAMNSAPLNLLYNGAGTGTPTNFNFEPFGIFGISQGLSAERCSRLSAILIAYRNRFLVRPFAGWTAQSVASGGRIDAIAHVGGGKVVCGSRSKPGFAVGGYIFTNASSGSGTWTSQGQITTDDIMWVGGIGDGTVYAISSTTAASKLWKNSNWGVGTWTKIDDVTNTAKSTYWSAYSGCITASYLYVVGTAGGIWRYNLDGSGKTSLGTVGANGLYRIQEGANGRLLVNGLEGRYFYSDNAGTSWTTGAQLTTSPAPLFAIDYFGDSIWLLGDDVGNYFKSYDNGASFYPKGRVQDGGTDDFASWGEAYVGSIYSADSFAVSFSYDQGESFCNGGGIANVTGQTNDVLDHFVSFKLSGVTYMLGGTTSGYVVTASKVFG